MADETGFGDPCIPCEEMETQTSSCIKYCLDESDTIDEGCYRSVLGGYELKEDLIVNGRLHTDKITGCGNLLGTGNIIGN